MSTQAAFALRARNPDVLTCIANLSNDEVFTPPEFANRMLDTLAEAWAANHGGANLWTDPTVTFLDPCTKSGVFLREITSRLTAGLAGQMPDLQERVNHILTKQVFGIGITRLTSLLARRSLYCSKHANGKHSIAQGFAHNDGNIWFERTEHTWEGDKCTYCGAGRSVFDRVAGLETHAYAFIHTDNIKARLAELFGGSMQFDVIIGNPPYQLQDGGHLASATPIYHKFIEQAINLEPRLLTMVVPSRWFQGGRGLGEFRSRMLNDGRIRVIVDFIKDKDAFPSINVNGGVNYFLWDRDTPGECRITTIEPGGEVGVSNSRRLNEFDILVRRSQSLSILRKVCSQHEPSFSRRVSPLKPFGLRSSFHGGQKCTRSADVKLHGSGAVTWVSRDTIETNHSWIDQWKVLVGRATDGNEKYPLPIWDQRGPFVAGPGEACSETYLVASVERSEIEAKRRVEYMCSVFFRFLVSIRKITQDNKADVFAFVPDVEMDRSWSDTLLFKRYGISSDEVSFMRSIIREMDFAG